MKESKIWSGWYTKCFEMYSFWFDYCWLPNGLFDTWILHVFVTMSLLQTHCKVCDLCRRRLWGGMFYDRKNRSWESMMGWLIFLTVAHFNLQFDVLSPILFASAIGAPALTIQRAAFPRTWWATLSQPLVLATRDPMALACLCATVGAFFGCQVLLPNGVDRPQKWWRHWQVILVDTLAWTRSRDRVRLTQNQQPETPKPQQHQIKWKHLENTT